jgi:ribosomal protein S6--L-glutamate ligase
VQLTAQAEGRAGATDFTQFDALLIRTMPPGSLEQVVFRMDVLGALESQGMLVVNPPRAIEAAVDKFLALARLAAAGLRVPRTFVCQTAAQGLEAFDELDGDAVLKPLFGSEGRGITRIIDRAFAQRAFRLLVDHGEVLYLQEFIKHPGYDLRVLLIGDRAVALRRRNAQDWRTNLSLGGQAERIEPTAEMIDCARRAAGAVGALLAGVDLIEDAEGRQHVLEVNAVPGWKASGQALGIDVAQLVLDYLARLVEGRRGG